MDAKEFCSKLLEIKEAATEGRVQLYDKTAESPEEMEQLIDVTRQCLDQLDRLKGELKGHWYDLYTAYSDHPEVKGREEAEQREWDRKREAYSLIAKQALCENMIWAIYDTPTEGTARMYDQPVEIHYDGGWGQGGSRKVEEPNVFNVFRACERLINDSEDLHHCFVEALSVKGVKNGYLQLDMGTGS